MRPSALSSASSLPTSNSGRHHSGEIFVNVTILTSVKVVIFQLLAIVLAKKVEVNGSVWLKDSGDKEEQKTAKQRRK